MLPKLGGARVPCLARRHLNDVLHVHESFTISIVQSGNSSSFSMFSRLGGRAFDAVMQLIATVPVVMSAYVCHQSVHPVMSQVRACLLFLYRGIM